MRDRRREHKRVRERQNDKWAVRNIRHKNQCGTERLHLANLIITSRCYSTALHHIYCMTPLFLWQFKAHHILKECKCCSITYKSIQKWSVSHRGHILFAAVTKVGSAHQVQEAAIRGSKTGHCLWELRGRLAPLGSQLPKHLHCFPIRWTGRRRTR